MKPFDLDAAKRGEPFTYDGRPVKFVAHVPEAQSINRMVYQDANGWIGVAPVTSPNLHMAPKKRTVWVVAYDRVAQPPGIWPGIAYWYTTEEEANAAIRETTLGGKAHKIEFEE